MSANVFELGMVVFFGLGAIFGETIWKKLLRSYLANISDLFDLLVLADLIRMSFLSSAKLMLWWFYARCAVSQTAKNISDISLFNCIPTNLPICLCPH